MTDLDDDCDLEVVGLLGQSSDLGLVGGEGTLELLEETGRFVCGAGATAPFATPVGAFFTTLLLILQ